MKKVLYISNIEVPYRTRFFNELAKECDLTVVYERKKSTNRDEKWSSGVERNFNIIYLRGINIRSENAFSMEIVRYLLGDFDEIIVGCINSPVQAMAILVMRLLRIPYVLNLDGEPFLNQNNLKTRLKKFILKGAKKYLVAGEKAAQSLKTFLVDEAVVPYYFSSLTEQEIIDHRARASMCVRNQTVLVVGQNYDYKGMDAALEAARMDPSIHYKFVGMGKRTVQFVEAHSIPDNVEIIPFLQKEELEKEYQTCGMLVLPSRQECWGLVINEAASYGMPIISTWGSGAAVEFIGDCFPEYLAQPGVPESLLLSVRRAIAEIPNDTYCNYLLAVSRKYTIEACVRAYMGVINR